MEVPSAVLETVLLKSESMPPDSVAVKGYDFNNGVADVHSLLSSYITTGFQATHFGRAVKEIENMVVYILQCMTQTFCSFSSHSWTRRLKKCPKVP